MAQRKRVVHMATAHTAYDTRIFVKECRTLVAAGYEVDLIARDADNGVHEGVKTWRVPDPRSGSRLERMTLTVFGVYRLARSLRADVYHFHDPELIPAGLALAWSGAPVIYDVHEDLATTVLTKPWIRAWLRRPTARLISRVEPAAARRLAAIVAATPTIAEQFSGVGCEVVTVNNYPDLTEFRDVLRPPRPSEPAVCYVGAITATRGIEVMVDAIAMTNARLVLAGWFDSPELRDRLGAAPGWARVEHLGLLDRAGIAEVFGRAVAGLVVLQPETNYVVSQPTKMFEYMAAGLPVIASDFPLLRDIVDRGSCGICVDPTRPEAVADAIRWMIAHPDRARQMGEKGRRMVQRTYNWSSEGQKLMDLYRRILTRCGRPKRPAALRSLASGSRRRPARWAG